MRKFFWSGRPNRLRSVWSRPEGLRSVRIVVAVLCTSALAAQSEDAEKKKWDVTAPLGPTTTIEFETSEGTWVNVDVSPDGRRLVFDLLGDLYAMPVEGGSATRLTDGPAFDMQPRFSPDGTLIAFSSDRDGSTNIWVVNADGKNPRQISKGTKWFINSPSWSPDGRYIFARSHFVKERSLGAGEIWMYHVGGAEGVQVTEKSGWQKDTGEPASSPDGKYLYYSKDVTPGDLFEYNKDPNGLIYAIIRRDLTDGKERRLIARPGGAVAPRPSPDGKLLAFVRRVRLKSVLFVHDLSSGEERPVFDRLDKDLQEVWAVHGVYPQYAWTPDGKSIVIWGQGKIWRVDVDAARGVEIPFTARVEQTLNEALRFPQQVHTSEFPVRMLRDVETAPDGRLVAYSALGTLYRKTLPDAVAERVTNDERLEFGPSFSADSTWLVYTTWTDAEGGRVRVVRADGFGGRDIVRRRGHYIEPSFSPNGQLVVFRSVGGDDVRGLTHGETPGIYIVGVDGSDEPKLVREGDGSKPQFDHTGSRIYLGARRGEKSVLFSVDLDGSDEFVHFQSDNATEIVPSPDGRWVAFAERYKAYVAAFPRSGRTVDLGPTAKGFPVAQISRDAGMNLHWSGDSGRVHWSLGPELFTRDLTDTFKFLNQKLEKSEEPEAKGVPIGFTMTSDAPQGTVALVGARIITMSRAEPARSATGASREAPASGSGAARALRNARGAEDGVIENGTIVIEGNRIVAVGRAGDVRVPSGARRIDVQGKTIMPGIIDVHAHVNLEDSGILAETTWPLVANLAFGVTTAHDPSNDTQTVFTTAEMIRAGQKLGPRLYSTGTILYGAETPFKAVVETYEDSLSHLRRMKAVGAFTVKSYMQQRRDARQMIIKAARELEMMVVPEGGSLLYLDETMVLDGHTGIEHSLPVPNLYKDVVTLLARSRTGYTPTMIVGYGGLFGENWFYQHFNVWENERLLSFVPRDVVDPRARRRVMAPEDDFNHILIGRGAKKVLDAGGGVQLGAHGQLPGLGAHWELWMFQQGGLTPMEALRCATIDGARYLGLEKELGSLETGKLADLVVLDRNPLQDIQNSASVAMVMLNGRLYDARTMDEIGNHPRKRGRFYWEGSETN